MAGKLRLEYPGAICHLMNRGDRREPIFRDDTDRQSFLEALGRACGKTDWQVHAFCLVSNHLLKDGARMEQVAALRDKLVVERQRLNGLLAQVEAVLAKVSDSTGDSASASARKAARPSPLDQVKATVASTADLREANGNLSAARIANEFSTTASCAV